MIKYLFILVVLSFILLYIYYISQYSFEKYKLWKNIKINFNLTQFNNICGNILVDFGDFSNNNIPNLYPKYTNKIKLKEWFSNDNLLLNDNNIQTRLFFYKESTHPISLYLINWLYSIQNNLPTKLQNILNNKNIRIKFSLRISRNKWNYPNHFDVTNNFMIIISGDRNVIFDNNVHYILKPNDIIYFKQGTYHNFYCNNINQLNMVFCISYTDDYNKEIDNLFIKFYNKQNERIIKNIDFI